MLDVIIVLSSSVVFVPASVGSAAPVADPSLFFSASYLAFSAMDFSLSATALLYISYNFLMASVFTLPFWLFYLSSDIFLIS